MNLPQGVCRPLYGSNQAVYFRLRSPKGLNIVRSKIKLPFLIPWFCGAVQFGNFLFICGGADRGTLYNHLSLREAKKYDIERDEMADILPGMKSPRTAPTLVAFSNSHVVAIGGCRDLLKNTMKSC